MVEEDGEGWVWSEWWVPFFKVTEVLQSSLTDLFISVLTFLVIPVTQAALNINRVQQFQVVIFILELFPKSYLLCSRPRG